VLEHVVTHAQHAFNLSLRFTTVALAFVILLFLLNVAHKELGHVGLATTLNLVALTIFFKLNGNQHVLAVGFVD
jgi:uncharacterized membrane protein YjjB (DUF3815 family)